MLIHKLLFVLPVFLLAARVTYSATVAAAMVGAPVTPALPPMDPESVAREIATALGPDQLGILSMLPDDVRRQLARRGATLPSPIPELLNLYRDFGVFSAPRRLALIYLEQLLRRDWPGGAGRRTAFLAVLDDLLNTAYSFGDIDLQNVETFDTRLLSMVLLDPYVTQVLFSRDGTVRRLLHVDYREALRDFRHPRNTIDILYDVYYILERGVAAWKLSKAKESGVAAAKWVMSACKAGVAGCMRRWSSLS